MNIEYCSVQTHLSIDSFGFLRWSFSKSVQNVTKMSRLIAELTATINALGYAAGKTHYFVDTECKGSSSHIIDITSIMIILIRFWFDRGYPWIDSIFETRWRNSWNPSISRCCWHSSVWFGPDCQESPRWWRSPGLDFEVVLFFIRFKSVNEASSYTAFPVEAKYMLQNEKKHYLIFFVAVQQTECLIKHLRLVCWSK